MAIRHRSRSTRLLVVVLVSLSLAIITLDYRQGANGPLAALGDVAQSAMAPLERAATSVIQPVGDFFSGLAHLPSLQDENRLLAEQVTNLRTQIASNEQYRELYEETLALLHLGQLNPGSTAAVVIATGVSNFEWSIQIDKGAAEGLTPGQPVVAGTAEAPMLVGKIVQVSEHTSMVQLLIDRRFVAAAVLDRSGESGEVEGQGDADLRMSLVNPTTRIQGGEAVFTESYSVNGLHGAFPPGILIGTVSRVVPADNQTEAFVRVAPAVDFSELRFVLVLRSPGTTP